MHTYPQSFASHLNVAASTVHDGTMLDRTRTPGGGPATENRKKWIQKQGYQYEDAVCLLIAYHELATYDRIATVDARMTQRFTKGIMADALITEGSGVSLFLPVADCVATVLYDSKRNVTALLHMGRHSCLTRLVEKTVSTMQANFGSDPADISAWLSPSAQKQSYRMDYFDQKDSERWKPFIDEKSDGVYLNLQGRIRQDLIDIGVLSENIVISHIDTVTNPEYFSHSAGDKSGRFAVMVTLE